MLQVFISGESSLGSPEDSAVPLELVTELSKDCLADENLLKVSFLLSDNACLQFADMCITRRALKTCKGLPANL